MLCLYTQSSYSFIDCTLSRNVYNVVFIVHDYKHFQRKSFIVIDMCIVETRFINFVVSCVLKCLCSSSGVVS